MELCGVCQKRIQTIRDKIHDMEVMVGHFLRQRGLLDAPLSCHLLHGRNTMWAAIVPNIEGLATLALVVRADREVIPHARTHSVHPSFLLNGDHSVRGCVVKIGSARTLW